MPGASTDSIETDIDALYRLAPSDFTAARGALAKRLTGEQARRVRALRKPLAVPWAVNQVYWQARPVYERVLKSGHALRAAEIAALKGKSADVRAASDAHRQTIAEAVHRATELAEAAGLHPDAASLARMFEALSLAEAHPPSPGRLTDVLQPGGFEALAGVAIKQQPKAPETPPTGKRALPVVVPSTAVFARQARERRHAAAARAAWRSADHAVKKAVRDLARARAAEIRARESLDEAAAAVRDREQAVAAARATLANLPKPTD